MPEFSLALIRQLMRTEGNFAPNFSMHIYQVPYLKYYFMQEV